MKKSGHRAGFTLVEVMVASFILVIVLAQFAVALVSCVKLFHGAMAQSELAIRGRELREKLLFHLRPVDEDEHKAYGGMTSAQDVKVDSSVLEMTDETIPLDGLTLERKIMQNYKLMLDDEDGRVQLKDVEAPDDDVHVRWLCPGGLQLDGETTADVVFDDRFIKDSNRLFLTLTLVAESKAGMDFGTRTERIMLPLFNTVQKNVNVINDIEPVGGVTP